MLNTDNRQILRSFTYGPRILGVEFQLKLDGQHSLEVLAVEQREGRGDPNSLHGSTSWPLKHEVKGVKWGGVIS